MSKIVGLDQLDKDILQCLAGLEKASLVSVLEHIQCAKNKAYHRMKRLGRLELITQSKREKLEKPIRKLKLGKTRVHYTLTDKGRFCVDNISILALCGVLRKEEPPCRTT